MGSDGSGNDQPARRTPQPALPTISAWLLGLHAAAPCHTERSLRSRSATRLVILPLRATLKETPMKRYLIERDIPGVGRMNGEQLKGASATSNGALAKLAGKVQWVHSYVTDDKTFCIYLADHEASVHEHARLSGFPASRVTEVRTIIEPMTAMC
jgi:hypothetical protein